VWFSTLSNIPKEFRQFMNVVGPNPGPGTPKHYFEDLNYASLGTFGQKPEGQPIQYDIHVEGTKVRLTPYTFGLGFRITEEMDEDELYGIADKMTRQLAMSAAHQMEVQGHRPINNGFATTGGGFGYTAAGFDSLALFSTSHTVLRGTTLRPNRLTTDMDLSVTALEQAQDLFETWINHSEMPDPKRGSLLIIPPQLKWIAKELTESELKPFTGNNEVNPLMGEGFQYMVDHYLSDSDSWYLFAPKSQHSLTAWIRREPRFQTGDDFDSGDTKAKGTFRMATGFFEPDGTFGSQGA
jgi:hypothetical protein